MKNQSPKKNTESHWHDLWVDFKKGDTNAFGIIYNEHINKYIYNPLLLKQVYESDENTEEYWNYYLKENPGV